MKRILLFLVFSVVTSMFAGCSKQITKMESAPQYYRKAPVSTKQSVPKTMSFETDGIVGYLDNPTPVYLLDKNDSKESTKKSEESSDQTDDEFGKIKDELDKVPEENNQTEPSLESEKGLVKTKQKRMVTYEAIVNSRSIRPDSLIQTAVTIVESCKGYVESRSNNFVTLRIPVAKFDMVYDSLLKLGEVIDFQRSAEDITDAFRDTDMRVTVLEKTIEQYVKLLRLLKKETDKISLLKEIERLREELENLRVQKSTLAMRAEYSKIDYSVEQITSGFSAMSRLDKIEGFEWIDVLDPLYPSRIGKKWEVKVPEGMVLLKDRDFWISQSPAGSRVWTSLVTNYPRGNSEFWIKAVACKMQEQFISVDTNAIADFRFIRCIPQPGVNYRYSIGVKVSGKSLQIIQCYFPDEMQEQRYFDSVRKILTTDGGAS